MKISPDLSTISKEQRTILLTAAVFGLVGLLLGVFGAHGIRDRVTPEDYRNYEKGVQYHYFFTAMLFAVALLAGRFWHTKGWLTVFAFFAVGIVLFSGSLYLISFFGLANPMLPRFIFLVTPMGGFCFIAGWVWLIVTLSKLSTTTNPS